ncbi:hypothetical protein O181_121517 [Austropuccinia psidii MF-1]|uniref:Uncharacterized protein n=1 Tax=Austropuccinia psidii MF-1 TaxID=1389203 RepID=A0A9Q3KJ40_9BASI|nr:hypothetical protein [Austropuccinia psidii MF-1]
MAFLAFLGSWGPTVRGPYAVVHGGYWRPPGPNLSGDPTVPLDQKGGPWPGTIDRVQDHQDPGLPKVAGEVLGDEFSPKGVLNHHLGGFKEGP